MLSLVRPGAAVAVAARQGGREEVCSPLPDKSGPASQHSRVRLLKPSVYYQVPWTWLCRLSGCAAKYGEEDNETTLQWRTTKQHCNAASGLDDRVAC